MFIKLITKIDVTTIDDAENLDLVMPIYNLMEYSLNYPQTTRSFGFIHKMKPVILMLLLLIVITVVNPLNITLSPSFSVSLSIYIYIYIYITF